MKIAIPDQTEMKGILLSSLHTHVFRRNCMPVYMEQQGKLLPSLF